MKKTFRLAVLSTILAVCAAPVFADPGGTGFWHETYSMRGGIEAIYLDMSEKPLGVGSFAPRQPARKSMFSARSRLRAEGATGVVPPVAEEEFYAD